MKREVCIWIDLTCEPGVSERTDQVSGHAGLNIDYFFWNTYIYIYILDIYITVVFHFRDIITYLGFFKGLRTNNYLGTSEH